MCTFTTKYSNNPKSYQFVFCWPWLVSSNRVKHLYTCRQAISILLKWARCLNLFNFHFIFLEMVFLKVCQHGHINRTKVPWKLAFVDRFTYFMYNSSLTFLPQNYIFSYTYLTTHISYFGVMNAMLMTNVFISDAVLLSIDIVSLARFDPFTNNIYR